MHKNEKPTVKVVVLGAPGGEVLLSILLDDIVGTTKRASIARRETKEPIPPQHLVAYWFPLRNMNDIKHFNYQFRDWPVEYLAERWAPSSILYHDIDLPNNQIAAFFPLQKAPRTYMKCVTQADVSIIIYDFDDTNPSTEWLRVAEIYGVQIILVLNFASEKDMNQGAYQKWKDKFQGLVEKSSIAWKSFDSIIPCCINQDVNIRNKIDFYSGKDVKSMLDSIKLEEADSNGPLLMSIMKIEKIGGIGTVLVGKIHSGRIKVGDIVYISPLGTQTEVKSIEVLFQQVEMAKAGMFVGVNVMNVSKRLVKPGYFLTHYNRLSQNPNLRLPPPDQVFSFTCTLNLVKNIRSGTDTTLFIHSTHIAVKINKAFGKYVDDEKLLYDDYTEMNKYCRYHVELLVLIPSNSPDLCRSYIFQSKSKPLQLNRFVLWDLGKSKWNLDIIGYGEEVTSIVTLDSHRNDLKRLHLLDISRFTRGNDMLCYKRAYDVSFSYQ